jgi:hypothetical protein
MERSQRHRIPGTPDRSSGLQMNAIERTRAEEGMKQALLLADLTLAGVKRVRTALNSAAHAMSLVYVAAGPRKAPRFRP